VTAPPATGASGGNAGLRERTLTGVAWTGGSRVLQQLIAIATTVVLARLLVPADFGLVALVVVFTGFAAVLTDLGLGAALIHRRVIEERHLSSAFWLSVLVGAGLAVLVAAMAPFVAAFYGEPRLTWITVTLASVFLVTPLAVVQTSLMQRDMEFRRLAAIENAATVVGAGVGIATAAAGFGVWGLVLMTASTALVRTAAVWLLTGWRPRSGLSLAAVRDLWRFSANLVGFQAINYWMRNADNLIVGKFLGAAALGVYGRAYNLMLQPVGHAGAVLSRVMFPALSSVQHDPDRVRRAYVRALALIGLITFPVTLGLLVAAEPLILTLYGPKWSDVVPILQILCAAALLQSVSTTVGWIYQSQGRTDWMFRWGLVAGTVTIVSFAVGVQWGVHGVATAYLIRTIVLVPLSFAIAGRLIGLRLVDVGRLTARTLVAAGCMAATVWLASRALPSGMPAWLLLTVEIAVGIASYAAFVALLRPPGLDDLRAVVGRRFRVRALVTRSSKRLVDISAALRSQ
jgi:PST family polysaccharide transporter